jgi:hypothetical protein
MSETQFEIDGFTFTLRTLKLQDACRGAELTGALNQLSRLPELLKLFAPYCTVEHETVGAGRKVPLDKFLGDVFDGHIDRAMLFAAECSAIEFGDFLGAGQERLKTGLEALAQRYPSLKAHTP